MKHFLALFLSIVLVGNLSAQDITFKGVSQNVISDTPDASTGLSKVYTLYSTVGVSMVYTSQSASSDVKISRFSSLGGAYAEDVADVAHQGNQWIVNNLSGDMGYIIDDGVKPLYIWVVDYSKHYFEAESLMLGPEQDCDMAALLFAGNGDKILYYTINGRPVELDRDIKLTYYTLEYNEDSAMYIQRLSEKSFASVSSSIHIQAPLCDTRFKLSGDRFLQAWGAGASVESENYKAIAVSAETKATQEKREADNEQTSGMEGILGGSAPAVIEFSAEVTDAVVFTEWQFSKDNTFDLIDDRVNGLTTTRTFTDRGNTYVRFVAANNDGTCSFTGPTYEIYIGDSALQCPNAFSPGASEGVNDIWKVSYKSIIEFDCHIFNKWGTEMFSFSDPQQGWDGKYKGKVVPSGVYYYVIKAKGADGKEYKLSGDINVVNYR